MTSLYIFTSCEENNDQVIKHNLIPQKKLRTEQLMIVVNVLLSIVAASLN